MEMISLFHTSSISDVSLLPEFLYSLVEIVENCACLSEWCMKKKLTCREIFTPCISVTNFLSRLFSQELFISPLRPILTSILTFLTNRPFVPRSSPHIMHKKNIKWVFICFLFEVIRATDSDSESLHWGGHISKIWDSCGAGAASPSLAHSRGKQENWQ